MEDPQFTIATRNKCFQASKMTFESILGIINITNKYVKDHNEMCDIEHIKNLTAVLLASIDLFLETHQ